MCTLVVSAHPFPTSVTEYLHSYPSCQQLHRCLLASHSLQNFQGPIWELVLQHILPSPDHHKLYKHQAGPSTQEHLVHRTWFWSAPLLHADGQHDQKDQPYRHSAQLLEKHHELNSWNQNRPGLHPLDLHGCMLTEGKQKWPTHLYSSTHPFKMLKSLLKMPMNGISCKHCIPSDSIACGHLVEHTLSIHYAPTFVNIVPMLSVPAYISHVPKSLRSKRQHCAWASYGTPSEHLLCSLIWHTCQQDYYPQKHQTHNHFEWCDCGPVCLLQQPLQ